jgi:hypothetical protein
MRHSALKLIFGALLVLCLGVAARADEPRSPGIEATINAQTEAFLADDFARAFGFASPSIKGIFVTPEAFGAMVTSAYPMVWRPADVRYLELRRIAGALWQRVMVTDQAGRVHLLDYRMVQTPEGWKVDAVQILPQAGVGV